MDAADLAVFRRHAADATLLAGGAAAILLQLAHPRVAAGVARHSDFASRPFDRLLGTLDYLYAVGFGEEPLIRAIAAEVDARHRPVHGRADASGRYSAFDPAAQRWVASTLLAVALALHERVAGPLPEAEADAIVRCYGELGRRLQAGAAGWPQSRAEFDAWWAEHIAELEVGDEARAVARAILAGRGLPVPVRPLLAPVRLITAATLPTAIRSAYGLSSSPRVLGCGESWLTALAVSRRIVPRGIRRLPMRISLRRARQRTEYAEHRGR
ncbi:oxygenase MpaB family protein [Agromyces soli]